MKIGIICDMHLSDSKNSPQYKFLMMAIEQLKKDKIDLVVNLGDITAFGNLSALENYIYEMKDFDSHYVLGNADFRCPETEHLISKYMMDVNIDIDGRRMVGINTPYGKVTESDCKRLENVKDGDIILMHHGLHKLDDDSSEYMKQLALKKNITIIHGHSHKSFDYNIGDSRVIGLRALDPDKSIGNFPCITYLDITSNEIALEEKVFEISKTVMLSAKGYFGLSCVDNHKDVEYSINNNVRFIELRCNGADWEPDMTLLPKIKIWREKTKGYLSVHMPNLKWNGNEIIGKKQWYQAVNYAIELGADGLTMHPPRVARVDMPLYGKVWNEYKELYIYAVRSVGADVCVGIENVHASKTESCLPDEEKGFGCTPLEIKLWIDALNMELGSEDRVGHVLDVGHAVNNGKFSSEFPVSRWYEIMGKRTVAYHIHQVLATDTGLKNHNAIESWFGPKISYASFFYSWENDMINHVPIFLEVRGTENFDKSLNAFNDIVTQ